MKNLISKWWFWIIVVVVVIILYIIGVSIVQSKVDTELANNKNFNAEINTVDEKYKILITEDDNKIFYLNKYSQIYELNTNILKELEETLNSYNFDSKSGQKVDNEIIINDISKQGDISYTIKYDTETNELKGISVKNFKEWDVFSNFNIIVMEVADLTIFNFNQEQLSIIWNHIKNNQNLSIDIGEWNIQNIPNITTFSIEKIN